MSRVISKLMKKFYHFDETPIGERILCVIFLARFICNMYRILLNFIIIIFKYYDNASINCKILKIKVSPYSLVVMSGELGALWVL